jgi:fructose-bisphosphate aldolase class I
LIVTGPFSSLAAIILIMPVTNINQDIAKELVETAQKICSPGKGILAADESTGTIKKRFDGAGIENTEANRAAYRAMLFRTKDVGKHISGCILYEETLFQKASDGTPMVELLKSQGIIPGIKVDQGLVDLPMSNGEHATQGLDGLAKRCDNYYAAGARFAKWRAVLKIGETMPSQLSIDETAHTLARYAAICQQSRLVPIVEPEVLADGAHSIVDCARVTEAVLSAVFKALNDHHILLEGCLLKPNMVTPGNDHAIKASPADVAFYTVRTLQRTVPPALVGVTFLSGGQSEEDASLNLSAMNAMPGRKPWALTFSYGRALQASTIKAWAGKDENVAHAQEVFIKRCKANGEAQLGTYKGSTDGSGSESLFVKGYVY